MKPEELDRLRHTLRRGDPVADGRAPAEEVRRLRARILAAVPATTGRRFLRPAFAGGLAALALALATGWIAGLLPVDRPPASAVEEAQGLGLSQEDLEPAGQQLQFTTPGGTRIVWVLYPDPPTESRGHRGPGGRS